MSDYNSKADFYDDYREYCPGLKECLKYLEINSNTSILDVGCGSGVFMKELVKLKPKVLHGLEPSENMLKKAKQLLFNDMHKNEIDIKLIKGYIEDLADKKYDIIICFQVIQNLTKNYDESYDERIFFFKNIKHILKDNGKLILTTRNIQEKSDYSDMYWYADPNIMPKTIDAMNKLIPKNIKNELELCEFKNIKKCISSDKIYKEKYYLCPELVEKKCWRAADSFWNHCETKGELDFFINFIKNLIKNNLIEQYINERNILRKEGHIIIISCEI